MLNSRSQRVTGLVLFVLFLSPLIRGQSSCAPPESMKEKFTGKPDTTALNDLGSWFGEQKNYSCAVKAFATSLQMDPKQKEMPYIAFMFGASLYLGGDTKDAIAALQESEKFGYHDIKLHLLLADALDSTHATAEAEAEWSAALEIDPEHSDALDNLSNDLMTNSNYKAVIDLLDTPRLAPLRTVPQCENLGLALAKAGKLEESARVLRDAVNTYPDCLPLARQLSDVLIQTGHQEEAAKVLEIARARQAVSSGAEAH
jgi:tetratricopeptide (TPR) repeat protein